MAWQPLPPDSDDDAQSGSDDRSHSTLSYDPSIEPSTSPHFVLRLSHPQTAFVAALVDPHDGVRTPVLSQNEPRSVYAGQGSHQPSPRSQQKLAELPVSAMPDVVDTFVLYDNL